MPRGPHRPVATLAALMALALALGCSAPNRPRAESVAPPPPAPTPAGSAALRVLFVGNSLTYSNDLPGMVAALSRAAGDAPPIEAGSVVLPGASLGDHLDEGSAAAAIATGTWDVVALQQGPSSLPESRVLLIQYTRQFDALIRAAGGRTALYMVWPEQARLFALDAVIESYTAAARDVNGLLFPAGLAWKIAWREDPAFPLYDGDNFHPSPLGTYVAALCAYGVLSGRSPIGLAATLDVGGTPVAIPAAQATLAQQAADEAIRTSHTAGVDREVGRSGR